MIENTNFEQKVTRNNHFKPILAIIFIACIVLVAVISVLIFMERSPDRETFISDILPSFVTGDIVDGLGAINVKDYDDNNLLLTVKDSNETVLGEVKLLTPRVFQVSTGYRRVAEFEINNMKEVKRNIISNMETYNIKKTGLEERVIIFDYKYWNEHSFINKTGELQDNSSWIEFVNGDELPLGKVKISLWTTVENGDHVEWIPSFYDIRLSEWAEYENSVWDDHGVNMVGAPGSIPYYRGICITANANKTLISMVTDADVITPRCYVYSGNSCDGTSYATAGTVVQIANASMTDDVANFSAGVVNLTKGEHYLFVCGGNYYGEASTQVKDNVALPINDTNVQWNWRVYMQVNDSSWHGAGSSGAVINIQKVLTADLIPDFEVPTVNLVSPLNNSNITSNDVIFNCTGNGTLPIINLSLIVDDTLRNSTQNTTTLQNLSLSTELQGLVFGIHNWTCITENTENNFTAPYQLINVTAGPPEVILNAPPDRTKTNISLVTFNCSSTDENEIVNMSFIFDGVVNETIIGTGASTLKFITSLSLSDAVYNWTCSATDNNNFTTIANNRTLTVHTVSPEVAIISPRGLIAEFSLGSNLTLNWSVIEFGEDIATHIINCSYTYNGSTTYLSVNDCVVTNTTSFQYQLGVDSLEFEVTDSFNFSITNTTSWSFSFIELNQIFNTTAFETDSEFFSTDFITSTNPLSVNAIFNYNGTETLGTTSCVGTNCTVSTTIDIPLVSSLQGENKSFIWEISIFNGTDSVLRNTSSQEQNITRIHLELCDATYPTISLNFSCFDERNLTRIDPFSIASTFQTWLGSGSVRRNSSFLNLSTDDFGLCVSPNKTFYSDAQIEYDAAVNSTYTPRNYFFQNDSFSNTLLPVPLYLLESLELTSFILKVQDSNILVLPNHLVVIERFYPGENKSRIVQISKTGDNGETIGFLETETADYKFTIKKDGVTLFQSSFQKVIPKEVPFTLTFTVGDTAGTPWEDFLPPDALNTSLAFNITTNISTFSYIDTSGNFSMGRLRVVKTNLSGQGQELVCNINSTLSSSTLVCNPTKTGSYISTAFVTRNGVEQIVEQTGFEIVDFSILAGLFGVFLGMIIILTASLMFKFHPIAGVVAVNLAIIFTQIMHLIHFGGVFISAIIILSIITIALIEK